MKSDAAQRLVAELGRKYLWWDPVGDEPHSQTHIIAQAMNLGTFDDIVVLERTVGKDRLVEVMLRAEPGWLSDRSWEFWRGRLSLAAGGRRYLRKLLKGPFMPQRLEPKFDVLPAAPRFRIRKTCRPQNELLIPSLDQSLSGQRRAPW